MHLDELWSVSFTHARILNGNPRVLNPFGIMINLMRKFEMRHDTSGCVDAGEQRVNDTWSR